MTVTDQPDVIVVGAGLAGLVATHELARAGRRVLVLDHANRAHPGRPAFRSPGRLLFASTAQSFLEKEVPLSRTRELHRDGISFDRDWWQRAAELGWASLLVPEELGGGSVSGDGVADLGKAAGRQPRIGCEEADGIISPGIGKPERRQMALVGPCRNRHQLDRIDAEPFEMGDDRRLGQCRHPAVPGVSTCLSGGAGCIGIAPTPPVLWLERF